MAFASPLTAEDEKLKLKFAAALLREPEPLTAARILFPTQKEFGKAMYIAQFWPLDDVIVIERKRLISVYGELAALPDKAKTAKWFVDIMQDDNKETKHRINAAKVYAQMMGYLVTDPDSNGEPGEELPTEPTYKIVEQ